MTVYATRERNGSDVRVIRTDTVLACIDCRLDAFRTTEIPAMLDHLDFHTVLGEHVPPEAFVRLRAEYADLFDLGAL
ncbi:hypothetical protein [Rhodococcus jostii]|uniref:hypothetical protein n=1 Tax=Rhodococcus jostii TaxID=132919 RepID=UPI003641331F